MKVGRSQLLEWVNETTECDYPKIESLSDGIGFCQILDAYYDNFTNEMVKLKFNSKDKEDWQRNFCVLNSILQKLKSYKQIDPSKMSMGNFSQNFQFLQYLYEFISQNFKQLPKKYQGQKRRIEILKMQHGKKVLNNLKKYLPTHLLTNDTLLKLDKNEYFNTNDYEGTLNSEGNFLESQNSFDENMSDELKQTLEKYSIALKVLEEDLNKIVKSNKKINSEIPEIAEEREYYLKKLQKIMDFCEEKKANTQNEETVKICDEIIKKITYVPEDFE